jgi:protein-disulfide isomerase
MMVRRPGFVRIAAALLACAALLPAGSHTFAQTPKRKAPGASAENWAVAVEARDGGHLIGNPEARTKLVEYMSYTCSHCAEFTRTGDVAIKLFLVPKGEVSFEIRHLLRDPIDLTAALLTHCGGASKFLGNHEAIMARHDEWMERARKATQAQKTRWSFGTHPARWRAIASDLGFYDIMEARGYGRPELDRCLSDLPRATALAEATERDVAAHNLRGTPSFVLDGKLLEGVHTWDALKPVLEKLD